MFSLFMPETKKRIEEDGFHVFWDEAIKSVVLVDNKEAIVLTAFDIPEPVEMILVMMCYGPWKGSEKQRPITDSNGETVALFDPGFGVVVEREDRFYAIPFADGTKFSVTRIEL